MSTTWKSLAAGFGAGAICTTAFFLHFIAVGVVLTVVALGYIAYEYLEATHKL